MRIAEVYVLLFLSRYLTEVIGFKLQPPCLRRNSIWHQFKGRLGGFRDSLDNLEKRRRLNPLWESTHEPSVLEQAN
jgi:hypothetical protein